MPWGVIGKPSLQPGPVVTNAPQELTTAASRYLHEGDRIFNAQQWGSWLEYALPDNPVAVDSIIEAPAPSDWSDYFEVSGAGDNWQAHLDRWDVKVVIAANDGQQALLQTLTASRGWTQRYSDSSGAVFTRAAGR